MLKRISVFLAIACIVYNFKTNTASLENIQILDATAVYERLLKRMTEIEKGLNLHLNYNITSASPKEKMFARRVTKQSTKLEKYDTQQMELSSGQHDPVNDFLSGDDFSVKNSRERTRKQISNRISKKNAPKISDLSALNSKNNGGTKGPRPIKTRNKQQSKYKKGHTGPINQKYPEIGDLHNVPPSSPQCSIDSRCGCCREKMGYPPVSQESPKRLNQEEINAIQKQIDELTARGCKVFHFQGSIVYSCENT